MKETCFCVIICVSLIVAGCGGPTGPKKYPVTGSVVINGEPAEQVAVTFHHSNPETKGNLRYPTAVTDDLGHFKLSSEGDGDGAVEGEYRVTFVWLSSPELDAFDMLNGAFTDPKKSEYHVAIPSPDNELPPFELTIPKEQIRRPSSRKAVPQ